MNICSSITPSSGPTVGGTTVTIRGIDLGSSAQEIEVRFNNSLCELIPSQYVPGMKKVCVLPVHACMCVCVCVCVCARVTWYLL